MSGAAAAAATEVANAQRLALFKIEGKKGQQTAMDELVNEALELQ